VWPAMKGFERILVGIDFSLASERAVVMAQTMLAPRGIIYFLHVAPDIASASRDYLKDPGVKELQRKIAGEAMDRLAARVKKSLSKDVRYECVTAAGDPAAEIIKVSRAKGVQIILLGIHGGTRSDLSKLGSTVDKVVRESHCPVLVVPTERV